MLGLSCEMHVRAAPLESRRVNDSQNSHAASISGGGWWMVEREAREVFGGARVDHDGTSSIHDAV